MRAESIEEALQNWALWRGAGAWMSVRSSGNVDPERVDTQQPSDQQPHYREVTMPVLVGLAIDVDNIVNTLRRELQAVLRAEYLSISPAGEPISLLTQEQKAVWLACSVATYERRLKEGRQAVGDVLDDRAGRIARIGASGS